MKTRVVCCGGGLAAIYFALNLPEDIELIWVMEDHPNHSNSYLAKGGVAIPVSDSDIREHIEDTLRTGCGLCDPGVVEAVITDAPRILAHLKSYGIRFDPEPGREGGHSRARIMHRSDQTGKYLVEMLWEQARKRKNTRILEGYALTGMDVQNNSWKSATVTNEHTGARLLLEGNALVLATGGCGNLFLHHTNGPHANGEGLGIAHLNGAEIKEAEFIQFHPTRLYSDDPEVNVLITEAFRGAGAVLRDQQGKNLMRELHPMGSLAPRDIISQEMFKNLESHNDSFLWLDFSAVSDSVLRDQFPYLHQLADREGFLEDQRMPVTPAAHYQCGGVASDAVGQTSINGLFALGEVARTGLHGANRLASNSLLELFHFGEQVAKKIEELEAKIVSPVAEISPYPTLRIDRGQWMMQNIKENLWHHFGILRDSESMETGLGQLKSWYRDYSESAESCLQSRRIQLRLAAAIIIGESALKRKVSLGCHRLR